MIGKVRELAKEWLTTKKVDAIFGLRKQNNDVAPYLFTDVKELKDLVLSIDNRICFTVRPSKQNIVHLIQKNSPDMKIGIIARGCDERALIELAKRFQIDLEKIEILGVACTNKDAEECLCPIPYPKTIIIGEKAEGVSLDKIKNVESLLGKTLEEKAAFWKEQLSKCIKCYGCRNVCPMCICKECKLEEDLWVKSGELPPDFPMYHFIRFYHMADRCIECGQCEKACPAGIPLLTISKLVRKDVKELFDYEAGKDVEQESPLVTTLDETPLKEEAKDVAV
ncbi:MAG: 4Fe-4S binding protein [Dehalococcoidales bacterium]|nr:4Fe-4S binding protein [Dehalococcoidales bacterium]